MKELKGPHACSGHEIERGHNGVKVFFSLAQSIVIISGNNALWNKQWWNIKAKKSLKLNCLLYTKYRKKNHDSQVAFVSLLPQVRF